MDRHAESHHKEKIIKVYKNTTGQFRPEEHTWNKQTNKFFPGSDARVFEVSIPDSLKCNDSEIMCRNCSKKKVDYSEELPLRSKIAPA